MNNLDIILRASKKVLFDKLQLNLTDSQINPIIQKAISLNSKNVNKHSTIDDIKIYNKEILKYILDYFNSYNNNVDTIENAINNLDLQRNQPVINLPLSSTGSDKTNGTNGTNGTDGTNGTNGTNGTIGSDGTIGYNGHEGHEDLGESGKKQKLNINEEPINITFTLPKNEIQYYKSYPVHSINRNINIYPNRTLFSFKLPKYTKLVPDIIIFDEKNINFSYISLIINDIIGTTYTYDFFPNNPNVFKTISDLQPIYTDNNNEFTLALYNDYNENIDIGIDNITIISIIVDKNNYIIKFNINDINFNTFIINELIFTKNSDKSFSCNTTFNLNSIVNSKCIPVLNNQFHLLFKQFL